MHSKGNVCKQWLSSIYGPFAGGRQFFCAAAGAKKGFKRHSKVEEFPLRGIKRHSKVEELPLRGIKRHSKVEELPLRGTKRHSKVEELPLRGTINCTHII
jgi:hypothetical protein